MITLWPSIPPFAFSTFAAALAPAWNSVSRSLAGIRNVISAKWYGAFAFLVLLLALAPTPIKKSRATTSPTSPCFNLIEFLLSRNSEMWLQRY